MPGSTPALVSRALVAVTAAPAVVWAAAGSPLGLLADARTALAAPAGGDPGAALVPAVALLAWALAGWLVVTAVLVLAAHASGAAGRSADRVTRVLAPAAVRRAVQLALGLGLAAGVSCAGTASAAPLLEAPGVSAPSLDWLTGPGPAPATAPPPAAAPAPAAAPPPAAAPAPAAPAVAPADGTVVVAPGDTLWSLAARSLGPGASAQQVAATWPAWWSANREVVGADPHLIHPGDRLTPPSPAS